MGTYSWSNKNRNVYLYDVNGNQTEAVYYVWDKGSNKWSGSRRTVKKHDNNRNLTEELNYKWDTENNDWICTFKSVYYWSEL